MSVPSFVKDGLISIFEKCNNDKGLLFKEDDCLIPSHFKALNSHTKMIWAFQYFPLLFCQSLHFPVVRLLVYVFMILSELFNLDKDLCEAQRLNHLLYLCYAALEGITPDSLNHNKEYFCRTLTSDGVCFIISFYLFFVESTLLNVF